MSEHSPAPWQRAVTSEGIHIQAANGIFVADVRGSDEESWANSRLIGVAPDLLALARRVSQEWCSVRRLDNEPCHAGRDGDCFPCWALVLARRYERQP